ncbi:S-adenosylmethionine decarboxylase SpeD [Psychromonas marina]|uniref:S-adenosylmethionine decarboxylase SpeD n=1 Tax=Psychromonas marina TaxID=88364 RepID=A0ABQ6DX66_9GAMM|nr:S-adenosylmethionine decarboxylase [Psychromonas marina]GLS89588.1 S-adenosylmethionine decarboxylase SpeD [Psychromonas marina]
MFYEGSEKRLEITTTINLLALENQFWQEMVKQAGAYIISSIESPQLKAFLLSESSLFVWQDRLLLITCGETHLIKASLFFQQKVARKEISSLLFQRHQAYFPERQKSSFQQDSLLLQKKLKGDSHHWNEDYCGDIFLFGNNQQPKATKNILMLHGLSGPFFEQLQLGQVQAGQVALQLQLAKHFNDFQIDHYSFEPKGYSMNAINGEYYFTVHITPEKLTSYLSFESNLATAEIEPFKQKLLSLLQPQRSYLMTFSPSKERLEIGTEVLIPITVNS